MLAIVVAKLPVPDPVTLPVRVIVWSPVFVPKRFDADIEPEVIKLVPVAAPISGVVNAGLSRKAKVFLAAPVVIVP